MIGIYSGRSTEELGSNNRCVCHMLKEDGVGERERENLRFRPSSCEFTRCWYRAGICVCCATAK